MTVHAADLATDLAAVTQPVNTARGLPNRFYTDRAVFEQEKRRVFFRNWAGLGLAKDLPEPGDAMPSAKIMPSDDRGRGAVPLAAGRWYDFRGTGCRLG